jgi:hypothetical protein
MQSAEHSFLDATSEDEEIRIERGGAVLDRVGGFAGFDANFGVRAQAVPEIFDPGPGVLRENVPPVSIDVHARDISRGWDGVDDGEFGAPNSSANWWA